MSLVQSPPAISIVALPNSLGARIYTLETDGLIREFCQDGVGKGWYTGLLDKKHQGSGSISAVTYTDQAGAWCIEVYTIYANRIQRWLWDSRSWTGGSTENYGQDYVYASRNGNITHLVTRNPKVVVTYFIDEKGTWHPHDGPDLG